MMLMHFRLLWMPETSLSSHLKIMANMYHVVDSLSGPIPELQLWSKQIPCQVFCMSKFYPFERMR